jgi:hypothetical protein
VKNSQSDINIGPQEAGKRRLLGIVTAVIAVMLAAMIAGFGLSVWWNILLFFPLMASMLGLIQAREKTCVALAAQGMCNMDDGVVKIGDEQLSKRLQAKANLVIYKAIGLALAITALVTLIEYLLK